MKRKALVRGRRRPIIDTCPYCGKAYRVRHYFIWHVDGHLYDDDGQPRQVLQ